MKQQHQFSILKNLIAGSMAGAAANFVGFPFDTIKVRLQTMPVPLIPGEPWMYKNGFDCFMKIIRKEGVSYLFRGISVPVVNSLPMHSVLFCCVSIVKNFDVEPNITGQLESDPSLIRSLVGGMFGGAATSLVVTPLDRVKCILQIEKSFGKTTYRGPFDCLKRIYKAAGVRGIYKGISVTAIRDVPAFGTMFFTNELVLRLISQENIDQNRCVGPLGVLLAGGVAGIAYWIAGLPADIVKTRYQTAPIGRYRGVLDVFTSLIRLEGVTALYTGFWPVIVRAVPVNAAFFTTYNYAMRFINYALPDL